MAMLTKVVEEVALMVVPVQIGIGGFLIEEFVIGYVFDSQSLYFSNLVARCCFVSMEVPRFVVAQVDTKVGNFMEFVDLVRLMVDVFEN